MALSAGSKDEHHKRWSGYEQSDPAGQFHLEDAADAYAELGGNRLASDRLGSVMGFNFKGMMRAMGEGVATTANVVLTEEVQQMRDQRMAQYRQQEIQGQRDHQAAVTADTRQYNEGLLQDERAYQSQAATQQAEAAAIAGEQERAREDEIRADKQSHDLAKLQMKADLDLGNKTIINNNPKAAPDYGSMRASKLAEKLGEDDHRLVEQTNKAVESAAALEDSLQVLEQMQAMFETGKTQQALAILGQYAGTDAGAAMQAWEGTISPIVLAKAEGLSGVLSDKDMEFLRARVPQFGNDPRANAIMIGLMRKGMERARANQQAINGHLSEDPSRGLQGLQLPHVVGLNRTDGAQTNIGAANDPAGIFQ